MAIEFFPVATHPKALDIVWCKFPYAEQAGKPGPKSRPGLVRSVQLRNKQTEVWVEIAYGTTKYDHRQRPMDLHIQNSLEIDRCGLQRATCFILDRIALLPWGPLFFGPRDDGVGPVIGSLSDMAKMQLEAIKVMRRGK